MNITLFRLALVRHSADGGHDLAAQLFNVVRLPRQNEFMPRNRSTDMGGEQGWGKLNSGVCHAPDRNKHTAFRRQTMCESEFCPLTVIHRHCAKQQVEPRWLLAGLIEAIGHWHRHGKHGSEANNPFGCETAFDHILGMTQDLELDANGCPMDEDDPALHFNPFAEHHNAALDDAVEPLVSGEPANPGPPEPNDPPAPSDPPDYVPSSLLEALYLSLVHTEQHSMPSVFESLDSGELEEEGYDYDAAICRAQRALRAILREAMNELEREGLEYAMQRDREMRKGKPNAEGDADWGGAG